MTFLWPELLWLLLALPLLVLAYRWLLRRRGGSTLRFASLGLVREAVGQGVRWRRHLPAALLLAALAASVLALARPSAVLSLPARDRTLILAVDVSGSMQARDVKPDRIGAVQAALREFLAGLPDTTRVGLVTFAATAAVAQPPTLQRDDLIAALDALKLQRGTATGSAILVSLQLLFPDVEFDLQAVNPRRAAAAPSEPGSLPPKVAPAPAAPGSFRSAAIILLSDGQQNVGPDAVASARLAAERGVRVFTVGIGTAAGEVLGADGWSMRVRLDEDTLTRVAEVTQARYFRAASAAELRAAHDALSTRIAFERRELEITALLAGLAGLLMLAGGALSAFWFGRLD